MDEGNNVISMEEAKKRLQEAQEKALEAERRFRERQESKAGQPEEPASTPELLDELRKQFNEADKENTITLPPAVERGVVLMERTDGTFGWMAVEGTDTKLLDVIGLCNKALTVVQSELVVANLINKMSGRVAVSRKLPTE